MNSRWSGKRATENNPWHLQRRLMAVAISAVLSGGAWAADAVDAPAKPAATGDKSGIVLQKVVVTAERREDDVQSIASAVTVIGGDTIESSEVRNAGDIIRFVPNMTADTTDGHGRPKFYIRGIGLSDASVWNTNPIGTYLDDVYIWNASTVGFPLFDLERVEVLRGPQGTLWGKNTTGGAINFISRKPTFDTDGYAKLSYGNYHNSVFEGAVGGAIKDDVLAARVSIHREDSDRYAQNSFVPGTERWSDLGVRTQFLAKFSSTFEALLNIHYRDFNGPVLQSGTTAVPTQTRFDVPSLVEPTDNLKQKGTSLTLNKKLDGGLTLTSITGYENFDRLQTSADSVTYESSRSRTDFTVRQFSQELRLASSKADRLSWIAGAYFFDLQAVIPPLALDPQFIRFQKFRLNRRHLTLGGGASIEAAAIEPLGMAEIGTQVIGKLVGRRDVVGEGGPGFGIVLPRCRREIGIQTARQPPLRDIVVCSAIRRCTVEVIDILGFPGLAQTKCDIEFFRELVIQIAEQRIAFRFQRIIGGIETGRLVAAGGGPGAWQYAGL